MPQPKYAEVAVFLPIEGTFHYEVPEKIKKTGELLSLIGSRVLVSFGGRGQTGVILSLSDEVDFDASRIVAFDALLDTSPLVSVEILELCRWMSAYYRAPLGEVLRAALPAGSTVKGSLALRLDTMPTDLSELNPPQRRVVQMLAAGEDALLQRALLKDARAKRKDLLELAKRGIVDFVICRQHQGVRDKTENFVKVDIERSGPLRQLLERSKTKLGILNEIIRLGGDVSVAKLKGFHAQAQTHIRGMAKLEGIDVEARVVRNVAGVSSMEGVHASATRLDLNDNQERALAALDEASRENKYQGFLLYGITGSGKTEVYLQAISMTLELGKSAIVLVPEISLTPQLAARFRARFGDDVAILHSGLTPRERFDEWHRLSEGSARIAVGARSAIFAPLQNLGMIVVDEEHDSSFKQEEGVRYHARDVALMRASRAGALCVLGSATPSLESYYGAQTGRLHALSLPTRATGGELPSIEVVDMRLQKPDQESMLTASLAEAMEHALSKGEQVILFLNRRGFDTFVVCTGCGHAFRCQSCSVSLTYHRNQAAMLCHYCGLRSAFPSECPSCKGKKISRRGVGTEKIADAVAGLFPKARVERLDRDVASASGTQAILERMASRSIDILVGTQMVTKGHDFQNVTLVGVLCADTGLSLPDFRASERTFQLLSQVAGRAGRGGKSGRVIIQTYRKEALAVESARTHDYATFFDAEIKERAELGYPPHGYLVVWRVDGPSEHRVTQLARKLASKIDSVRNRWEVEVLGPAQAPLSRLKGRFRWQVWGRSRNRRHLHEVVNWVKSQVAEESGVRVSVDIDPMSSL